jgi:hypothetical protein
MTTLAHTWSAFYIHTLVYDETECLMDFDYLVQVVGSGKTSDFRYNYPDLVKEAEVFGQLMAQVPGMEEPSGTEDRIPVRTFYVLSHPKQNLYPGYITFSGMDWLSIAGWVKKFVTYSTNR